jgi:hypothetical protein
MRADHLYADLRRLEDSACGTLSEFRAVASSPRKDRAAVPEPDPYFKK